LVSIGIIPGATTKSKIIDLPEITRIAEKAVTEENYYLSQQWYEMALQTIGNVKESQGVKRAHVLDQLSYAEYKVIKSILDRTPEPVRNTHILVNLLMSQCRYLMNYYFAVSNKANVKKILIIIL